MTEIVIRRLDLGGLETLIGWAKAEGWNPGLADAQAFHAADPKGFFGCFADGEMAAGISAVRYGSEFGFIGLYIAHPDYRGRGYGRRVWDAGIEHLAGCTIGLDGVPDQQANYREMGFLSNYDSCRWSGQLRGEIHRNVRPVDDTLLAAIIAFDRRHFPAAREAFLREWLKPPRTAKAIIRDDALNGYAVARKCHDGFKIGPLFASDEADAMALMRACAAEHQGETLHIDVPMTQRAFTGCLEMAGFSAGFRSSRMYRGPAPRFDGDHVFGVTTLELG